MEEQLWYAEDLRLNEPIDLGTFEVTEEGIRRFAETWDPLPVHTISSAAEKTPFDGIIGSGLHTMAIFQRLAVLEVYRRCSVLAGRALRRVEFLSPLRPGMIVRGELTFLRVQHREADRSLVTSRGTMWHDKVRLLEFETDGYFFRKGEVTSPVP